MVKLTAAATASIPRVIIFSLTLVYGLAGLFERDPWKNEDAIGFGVMWTLHHGGLQDWLVPHLAGQLKNQWLKKLLLKNPLNFAGGKQHIPRGRKKAACAAFFIGTHRVVAIKVLAIETENLKFLKLRN